MSDDESFEDLEQKEEASDDNLSSSSDDSDSDEQIIDTNSTESLQAGILEIKVREDPYNYEKNLDYIKALSKITNKNNYQVLREAREKFQSIFPLQEDVWLQWFNDEQKFIKSDSDKEYIIQLYEKALNDFISVKINISYCKYLILIKSNSIKEIRDQFERSLKLCGNDLMESQLLWSQFRLFEQIRLSQLTQQDEKEKQINVIRNLYQRQLSEPINGLKELYKDYEQWEESQESGQSVSSNIELQDRYKQALKEFNERLPFEQSLKESNYLDHKKWKEYLEFEKKASSGRKDRVVTIFERELKYFPNFFPLWKMYLGYIERVLKSKEIQLQVFSRSLRSIYYSGEHWSEYLRLLQHQKNLTKQEMDSTFQRALYSGLQSAYDYQLVYNTYIDYCWRYIKENQQQQQQQQLLDSNQKVFNISDESKQEIKLLFDNMNNYMSSIDSTSYTLVDRYMYIAKFEYEQLGDYQRYREILNYILDSLDQSKYWIWNQYIQFELTFKNYSLIRDLYKRASRGIRFDDPTSRIWQDWFEFERIFGSLEQYEYALDQYNNLEYEYKKEQDKINQKVLVEKEEKKRKNNDSKEDNKNLKKQKSIPVHNDSNNNEGSKSNKEKQLNNKSKSDQNKDNKSQQQQQQQHRDEHKDNKSQQQHKDEQHLDHHKEELENEKLPTKIIIFNLAFEIGEEELKELFGQCGVIKHIKLVLDKNGHSKGLAFITFSSHEAAQKSLELNQTKIKDRPITVQFAKDSHHLHQPSSTQQQVSQDNIDYDNISGLTVFINNLSNKLTKDKLESFFTTNGVKGIKDLRLVMKARPFAYMDLIDKDNLKAAIQCNGKYLLGNHINVYLSKPPSSNSSTQNNSSSSSSSSSSTTTTSTTTNIDSLEIPNRKPTLLVPRGLKKK